MGNEKSWKADNFSDLGRRDLLVDIVQQNGSKFIKRREEEERMSKQRLKDVKMWKKKMMRIGWARGWERDWVREGERTEEEGEPGRNKIDWRVEDREKKKMLRGKE